MLLDGDSAAVVPVLVVAGLAQIGDAIVGVRQRNLPMALTCLGLAAVHLVTAAAQFGPRW